MSFRAEGLLRSLFVAVAEVEYMPYANGEIPVPGHYIKNEREQPGTVFRVSVASNGEETVSVHRDDGGRDSPLL